MTENQNVLKQKTKQMICDGLLKSLEIVVSCHGENCSPRTGTGNNLDYIKVCTKNLLPNLSIPYCLDLYLDVDNKNGMNSVLIERWTFHYDNRRRDSKEGRITAVNRHVGILVRTLYCFVRLLPSFQLSTQSNHCPLSFHVYPVEADQQETSFLSKPLHYQFPSIPTQYGYFSLSLKYLDSQSIKAVYSNPRSENIPIPSTPDVVYQLKSQESHARRHSISATPDPIPIPKGNGTGKIAPSEVISTWGSYSGELRSPTQRPSDLIRPPVSVNDNLQNFPSPPELTRNQSRSADSKPKYLLQDHYFGIPKSSERERSVSVDKERWARSGRPPQHPETSSFSSQASSPFSNTPAPFYIGGGSYTPSEGGNLIGLTEEIPVDLSPPFQIPCVGLLSTSPSTGPGSSIALLRDQLIGSKVPHAEKSRLPHSEIILVRDLLPDLPESPFDNEQLSIKDTTRLNRDSGQDSSISGLANQGGNADTDCIFAYDENDRDSLFGDDEQEEMPFAWAQTPTDSFLLQKSTPSRRDESNLVDLKSSMIAQQCLAPPTLNGFETLKLGNIRQNSVDAFAKFDQMKEFHITTLSAKS